MPHLNPVPFDAQVVTGFHIGKWKEACGREKFQKMLEEVMGMFSEGKIQARVGETFPLESAAEAVQAAVKPGSTGKVLIKD